MGQGAPAHKAARPPYSDRERSPGYITGYGEGFRENGGQYTHGAIWLAIAALRLGRHAEGTAMLETLLPETHVARIYQAEPFVLPADICTARGHEGLAGWTWYTGSAGWYFRAVTQELLGLRMRDGRLYIEHPVLPEFSVHWTDDAGGTHTIERTPGGITVDGKSYDGGGIG